MRADRDWNGEMHRFPIDDGTADRLLSGNMAPEDAPPGFAGLTALFHTATGPATYGELLHEDSVVAAGIAAVHSSLTPLTAVSRRKSMLSRLLTAKVAAAATIAVFGLGTAAAAAAGALPGQTSQASTHASSGLATAAAHLSSSGPRSGSTTGSSTTTATTKSNASTLIPATGPANIHAQFGLCTAFLAGNPTVTGSTSTTLPPQDSSTAFQALIHQNGGVAATRTYCQGVARPGQPSSTGKPSDTGKPSHPGQSSAKAKGSPTGKPSSSGSSTSHAAVPTPNSGGTRTTEPPAAEPA